MGITIRELAEISGYSSSTICRVINNSGGVKKETREAIERLLDEYQYRTNVMDLRRTAANCHKVLVIVGNLGNGFYMEQVKCISQILRENGYDVIIATSQEDEKIEKNLVQMAKKESYAGVIFTDISAGSGQDMPDEKDLPFVCLNRNVPLAPLDSVITDNYQGGYLATQYLIDRGHRKILFLAGKIYSYSMRERERGFREAMFRSLLPITSHNVYHGNLDIKSGYAFGEMLIKKYPDCTAVFTGNDMMGIGFFEAMRDYGVRVPKDISLICYDHSPIAESLGFTSVGVSTWKMAEKAVDILTDRIHGNVDGVQDVLLRPGIEEGRTVQDVKE